MTRGRLLAKRIPLEIVVFVVAVIARLIPIMRFGGFDGNYGYDASVYYAGSSALLHGRLPYRDFVMLHPPGILLADTPFAALGRLTSDHIGFSAAVLAATVVGGINAVLVVRVATRLGLDRMGALAGGLVYALWFGSIAAEYLPRLEPLGNLLILLGGLALLAAHQSSPEGPADFRHRWLLPLLGGAALGGAISVKLWWAVPILIVFGWLLVAGRRLRTVLVAALGGVVAVALIDGPFLIAARSTMTRMIVSDQLGRTANNTHNLRVLSYLAIGSAGPTAPQGIALIAVAVAAVVLLTLVVRGWRHRPARVAIILLAAQLIQIGLQPSWFTFYADLLTIALSLTVAAGVAAAPERAPDPYALPDPRAAQRRLLARRAVPVVVAVTAVALLPGGLSPQLINAFPRRQLTAALAGTHCVQSDSPMGLIQTNTLTRDLHLGCELWVDVTGKLYDVDRPVGNPRKTSSYARWQTDIVRYLRSGDAVLFVRQPGAIRISRSSQAAIKRDGLIVRIDGYAIYRTRRS
ncbi:MAG TPA: hypothetical protein VGN18_14915 [Jatrophihabitans sp.]|jgi:hypothetical protein|uniref:hypothetical protein n=1 Tax=Jatrophihabitans sp. TaxID=1932789 RepID=UPI002E0A324D|nr:hypothetical protein [Jatrophihabitans sp.]